MWLRSDTGLTVVSTAVSSWADTLSGGGLSVTQATGSLQPAFPGVFTINGISTVGWSGSLGMGLTMAASPISDNSPRSIMAMVHGAFDKTSGCICYFGGAALHFGFYAGVSALNDLVYGSQTTAITTSTDLTAANHLFEMYATGVTGSPGALSAFMDGVALPLSTTTVDLEDGTAGFNLGRDPRGAQAAFQFEGGMAEFKLWNRVLTGPEITAERAYFTGRYGIP